MPTIKDVARAARVSVATVSRTLSAPQSVKEATRERVEAAIRKTGYRPNALASRLRRQKSDSIVVVVPSIHNPFFSNVIRGIENLAHLSGYKVLLGESQGNQERLDSYAGMLARKEADGLILLGALLPSMLKSSAGQVPPSMPIVSACEYFDHIKLPNVRIDNVAAAAMATDHLIRLGHTRIAKITGPMHNPLSRDRLAGFRQAMTQAKLKVDEELVVNGDFSAPSGYAAMKALLGKPDRPTGVFSANDEMAIGAIRAIKETRLRIPRDISIIGFDDIRFSGYCDPPLTTIHQPQAAIGEMAMQLMIEMLQDEADLSGDAARTIILPHSLIVRTSTGRAD
jgi:LacI family transcriptional regulator, repressor for deo operon, udp, cdd, tsx, nupC, and nupG